eukprot:2625549-Prymnesium_polylepis.3
MSRVLAGGCWGLLGCVGCVATVVSEPEVTSGRFPFMSSPLRGSLGRGPDRGRTGKRAQITRQTEQRYDELAGGQVGGGGVEGFTSAVAARSIRGASGDMS